MIRFECDYAEGAHPRIIERIVETTNRVARWGDGNDDTARRIERS